MFSTFSGFFGTITRPLASIVGISIIVAPSGTTGISPEGESSSMLNNIAAALSASVDVNVSLLGKRNAKVSVDGDFVEGFGTMRSLTGAIIVDFGLVIPVELGFLRISGTGVGSDIEA